jgi:parallel beta-helix repeat protein
MSARRKLAGAALAVATVGGIAIAAPAAAGAAETVVGPGESIQAALDAASPGDTIRVMAGTYHEFLQIETDGVTLEGDGAILEPPTDPDAPTNLCSEGSGEGDGSDTVGICIIGDLTIPDNPDEPPTVNRMVQDVTLRGFTVRGFTGMGAFAFGSDGFTAEGNTFANNGYYGVFANTSTNTTYRFNTAYGNEEAGFYVGDSPEANATVQWNWAYDNANGILWRDSLGGSIDHNAFYWNCVGILVLDTGAPGASGDVTVADNSVTANNQSCPGEEDEGIPPTSGIGVALLGATGTTVTGNRIQWNMASGPSLHSGGLLLASAADFGGAVPTDNTVSGNTIDHNLPDDVVDDGTGSGNSVS